ncbi:MAG: hypothetical protein ACYCWW_11940 [Deltaproteobacteria bacterium]
MCATLALTLGLALTGAPSTLPSPQPSAKAMPKPKPPAPPRPLALSPLPGAPLVGSPSFTPTGDALLISRYARPGEAKPRPSEALYLVEVKAPRHPKVIPVVGPSPDNHFSARLSWDGTQIAYLARGELWLRPVGDGAPRRLYPPKEGDAPIGPELSFAIFSPDQSWILLQSPRGWARLAIETGEIATLGLNAVDLTGGSLMLGPEGIHVAFVRPQSGAGWQNGAKVIALNLETGQAQLADFQNDYVAVLVLPDGQLLGEDTAGELWILRGNSRVSYFKPPALPSGTSVGEYALALNLSRIAFVTSRGEGKARQTELWVGGAPRPPPRPKLPGPDDAAGGGQTGSPSGH